jgi:hypothetical protein
VPFFWEIRDSVLEVVSIDLGDRAVAHEPSPNLRICATKCPQLNRIEGGPDESNADPARLEMA